MEFRIIFGFAALMGAACLEAMGQTAPIVNRIGYTFPARANLTPGQLVTLFVTGIPLGRNHRATEGTDLETTMSGISVGMSQYALQEFVAWRLPILEVRSLQTCFNAVFGIECLPPMAAVTVQVPFEMETTELCPSFCFSSAPSFDVRLDGVGLFVMEAAPFPDQVHILRAFDSVLPIMAIAGQCFRGTRNGNMGPQNLTGLPCPPIVKHGDGSLVTAANPAKAGVELVAHTVGLGRTSPASETGRVVRTSAPTITKFAMDFNYRPNALGTRPPPVDTPGVATPVYTGTLEGSVGLYEVRFVVPPVPQGTPPCASLQNVNGLPRDNVVYSNLTFSVGGRSSFDGAGICVAVEEE